MKITWTKDDITIDGEGTEIPCKGKPDDFFLPCTDEPPVHITIKDFKFRNDK